MPLLRASIVIALIFAFSPVREGGPQPTRSAPERIAAPERTAAPVEQPTIESLIRGSTELRERAVQAHENAAAAQDAWRMLPVDAQDALARMVANELRSGIYAPDR